MHILCLSLALAPLAAATLYPGPPANNQHFDYVIVGGGTAGLVLANRLSADPHTTVAVLEAGSDQRANPNVTDVEHFGDALGSSIDWQYVAAPQRFASPSSKPPVYNQGRGLGGTSLINGATYVRSTRGQIDGWDARFGNTGWNWDALYKCYLKSEHFEPPTPAQTAAGASYDPAVHGTSGPLDVAWQTNISAPSTFRAIAAAWAKLGYPKKRDVNDGNPTNFALWPRTLDRAANIRWDAARAYLYPVADRPNLHVFQNTLAEKLVWAPEAYGSCADAVASGVQAHGASDASKKITVLADKEVVLSAGAIKSPALLEASGVGNPAILKPLGIPVKIALPSVGENLQDQPLSALIASVAPPGNLIGYPTFVTYPNASALLGANASFIESTIRKRIPSYAARIVANSAPNATTTTIQEKLLAILTDLVFRSAAPAVEILTATAGSALVLPTWPQLPLSRGSVHITGAASPATSPRIDPQFWLLDADDALAAAALRTARAFVRAAADAGFAGAESAPGTATVPEGASDAQWAAWAKGAYSPNYHPSGTCAMMRRELGGVVGPTLRVYGARNVRVCDASVLPSQTVGHLTSTIYAVAERAAALMLGRDGC